MQTAARDRGETYPNQFRPSVQAHATKPVTTIKTHLVLTTVLRSTKTITLVASNLALPRMMRNIRHVRTSLAASKFVLSSEPASLYVSRSAAFAMCIVHEQEISMQEGTKELRSEQTS